MSNFCFETSPLYDQNLSDMVKSYYELQNQANRIVNAFEERYDEFDSGLRDFIFNRLVWYIDEFLSSQEMQNHMLNYLMEHSMVTGLDDIDVYEQIVSENKKIVDQILDSPFIRDNRRTLIEEMTDFYPIIKQLPDPIVDQNYVGSPLHSIEHSVYEKLMRSYINNNAESLFGELASEKGQLIKQYATYIEDSWEEARKNLICADWDMESII